MLDPAESIAPGSAEERHYQVDARCILRADEGGHRWYDGNVATFNSQGPDRFAAGHFARA